MANARPEHRTDESPLIASALRTLDTEAGGIAALVAAIHGALGGPFAAAVDLIAQSKGRLIVTGMGKSGHVGRKIAATFASTGTPAYFVNGRMLSGARPVESFVEVIDQELPPA